MKIGKPNTRTMKSIVLILSVLNLLPYFVVSAARWSEDEDNNNNNNQRTHYKLGKFAIQLDNTPSKVEPSDAVHVKNILRKTVEDACQAHIDKQVYTSSGELLKFEYLILLDVETMEWYDPNDEDDEAATASSGRNTHNNDDGIRKRRRLQLPPESLQDNSRRNLQDTTLVVFRGGTAAFDSAVEDVEIEKWVREAIAEELVEFLATGDSDSPFSQVTSAKYISLKVEDDEEGNADSDGASSDGEEDGDGQEEEEDDGEVDGQQDQVVNRVQTNKQKLEASESDGLSSAGKVTLSVVGALVAMAGIIVFAKRRQRHANAISDLQFAIDNEEGGDASAYDMEEMTEDGAVSHLPAYLTSQRGRAGSSGAGSIDDDAASGISGYTGFTSSVGGDSCDYNGSRTSSSALQPSTSVYRENFDRETRLQKDMLQGDWGYIPTKSNQTTGALQYTHNDQLIIDDASDDNDPNNLEYVHAMSFEKAYDDNTSRQSEDILTMPASTSSRKAKGSGGGGGVAC